MFQKLFKKKRSRFLIIGILFLSLILPSTLYPLPSLAHGIIPLSELPVGSPGSNTLDIKDSPYPIKDSNHGAFRLQCVYSHMNYDDPIVFPNQVGATHLHTFFGNTLTNASSTYQSLTTSGNSTCQGGIANRSAYWVPSLLDNAGKPVVPSQMVFYYKSFTPSIVKNVPNGLKLLVGDAKSTVPQTQSRILWKCVSSSKTLASANYIPSCAKGNSLILSVEFPNCWDGVNLDSPNHKDHTSYPVKGSCPASHPVKLLDTTINVHWPVTDESSGKWRLSSDMYDCTLPGGYSTHADWFEAWQPEIRTTWFANCLPTKKDCGVGLLGNGKHLYFKK